jgi:DNA repair photolyase
MGDAAARVEPRAGSPRLTLCCGQQCHRPDPTSSPTDRDWLRDPVYVCSNTFMRWSGQSISGKPPDSPTSAGSRTLPGLRALPGLIRTVTTPEFAGVTFHEVLAKSVLNHVPDASSMPFRWTVNPWRGCTHACVYCYARGTHAWLELDTGLGFDTQIVVKVNAADVLRRELSRPSWTHELVALGTNTDPYQRAEGRYRLMPGIISALADSRTPFSILTKGTLLRRDLPELAAASRLVQVRLGVSIAILDAELQQSLEPGAPSARARLDLVSAITEAGFRCHVMVAPALPVLTDSAAVLNDLLAAIARAGATSATVLPLTMRPGAREWFFGWLRRNRADLLPHYAGLYSNGSNAPRSYRADLAARVAPLLAAHGLAGADAPGREAGPTAVQAASTTVRDLDPPVLF